MLISVAAEGAVEVEDESEIDEAATTEHPQGTVEVEEEEQSQIDEARKTDYHGDRDTRPAKKANFIHIPQEEFEVKDEHYNLETSAPPGMRVEFNKDTSIPRSSCV
ncbi:hypothetical protein C1H46_026985 [Malus baccata]|uniref:Uncharacterized protein n=1 Tax=Malus baccata TaxID=106549 RepID=A0A540LLX8_MALBA|nr:hypothetical protein C1H46_026985 [Malus baccata]